MTNLTYRQTSDSPVIYRVSTGGVEIGSISLQTRHLHRISTYWHWGVDIMPVMSHGGRPPSGEAESFEAALAAFKQAFTSWHASLPPETSGGKTSSTSGQVLNAGANELERRLRWPARSRQIRQGQ